jgi:hypothetical protein
MMRALHHHRTVSTGMHPVDAHLAHLHNLARPAGLASVLRSGHQQTAKDARLLAETIAPFIRQGLNFHEAARTCERLVRPVLLYYAYLNLAAAAVRIWRPPNWEGFRSHGARDLTHKLPRLSLSSEVVKVERGTLTLFHSILSSAPLEGRVFTLRELLSPIHMVSHELSQFGVRPFILEVTSALPDREVDAKPGVASTLTFRVRDPESNGSEWSVAYTGRPVAFPKRQLLAALPQLATEFQLEQSGKVFRTYRSKQIWTASNKARAEKFHHRATFLARNFGGQLLTETGTLRYAWVFEPGATLVPTMSAALLVSFVLASLARYRADLLERVDSSRVSLLCEVFASEADSFMIPAFRSILCGELVILSERKYV